MVAVIGKDTGAVAAAVLISGTELPGEDTGLGKSSTTLGFLDVFIISDFLISNRGEVIVLKSYSRKELIGRLLTDCNNAFLSVQLLRGDLIESEKVS